MITYKYIKVCALVCVSSLFFGNGVAKAENSGVTIVPGVSYGYKNSSFKLAGLEFTPKFIVLDTSLSIISGKFYVSANYDASVKDDLQVPVPGGTVVSFSREDYAVTAGYGVWKKVSLFAGYKSGKTEAVAFADPGADPNVKIKFEEDGPFVGFSVSHNVSNTSTLGASIAYASLDGSNFSGQDKGDTTGLSVGLTLTGNLSETVDYQIGLKAIRYEFDHDVPAGVEDSSSELNFDILTIGIKRYF
jgi:hypothetical protein